MQLPTSTEQKLKLTAGVLGLIQSVAWIIMGILCAKEYFQGNAFGIHSFKSYNEEIQQIIYLIFIHDYYDFPFRRAMTSAVFMCFVFVYVIIDISWLIHSLMVLFRKENSVPSLIKQWSCITWLVCLVDFIVVVILGSDYQKCMDGVDNHMHIILNKFIKILGQSACYNGYLTVLVIAAKGFVLWIVNLIFGIILFKMPERTTKQGVVMQQIMGSQIQSPPNSLQYSLPWQNQNNFQSTSSLPTQSVSTPNQPISSRFIVSPPNSSMQVPQEPRNSYRNNYMQPVVSSPHNGYYDERSTRTSYPAMNQRFRPVVPPKPQR